MRIDHGRGSRPDLDRHEIYSELADKFEEAAKVFSDTALAMAASVKPVALAGYAIAKPISKRNVALREQISKALALYGTRSAAAAATRRTRRGPASDSSDH